MLKPYFAQVSETKSVKKQALFQMNNIKIPSQFLCYSYLVKAFERKEVMEQALFRMNSLCISTIQLIYYIKFTFISCQGV